MDPFRSIFAPGSAQGVPRPPGAARAIASSVGRYALYRRYSARDCVMKLIGPIAAINNGTELLAG